MWDKCHLHRNSENPANDVAGALEKRKTTAEGSRKVVLEPSFKPDPDRRPVRPTGRERYPGKSLLYFLHLAPSIVPAVRAHVMRALGLVAPWALGQAGRGQPPVGRTGPLARFGGLSLRGSHDLVTPLLGFEQALKGLEAGVHLVHPTAAIVLVAIHATDRAQPTAGRLTDRLHRQLQHQRLPGR